MNPVGNSLIKIKFKTVIIPSANMPLGQVQFWKFTRFILPWEERQASMLFSVHPNDAAPNLFFFGLLPAQLVPKLRPPDSGNLRCREWPATGKMWKLVLALVARPSPSPREPAGLHSFRGVSFCSSKVGGHAEFQGSCDVSGRALSGLRRRSSSPAAGRTRVSRKWPGSGQQDTAWACSFPEGGPNDSGSISRADTPRSRPHPACGSSSPSPTPAWHLRPAPRVQ